MLDINQYTYTDKPFTQGTNFVIKPLDDEGRHTYFYDPESHTKVYLDKLNPRMLRKTYEERNENDRLIEAARREQFARKAQKSECQQKLQNRKK